MGAKEQALRRKRDTIEDTDRRTSRSIAFSDKEMGIVDKLAIKHNLSHPEIIRWAVLEKAEREQVISCQK